MAAAEATIGATWIEPPRSCAGLDLVGLNEVLGPKLWEKIDQCQELGERLGMSWLFAPTESRWWDGSFGNGMLSGLPVKAWQRIPFPRAARIRIATWF